MHEDASKMGTPHYTVLYEAHGISAVRVIHLLGLSCCIAGLCLALVLLKVPPQALVSQHNRLGWAVVSTLAAVACPLGAWYYGRHMATRVLLSADQRTLRVYETTLLGTTEREIPLADIQSSPLTDANVSNPITVHVRQQRSFVIGRERRRPTPQGRRQRQQLVHVLQG